METRKKLVYGPDDFEVKYFIAFVKVSTRNFSVFIKQCPDSSQWSQISSNDKPDSLLAVNVEVRVLER